MLEASYVKKHHLTEKRAVTSVHMGQQVTAVRNTQKRLEKAGIPDPKIQKELEKARGSDFLGPQLHTPWGENRLPETVQRLGAKGGGDDGDDEDDEEMREAMAIINRHDPPETRRLTKKEADREELAAAFLRSSHAGLLYLRRIRYTTYHVFIAMTRSLQAALHGKGV